MVCAILYDMRLKYIKPHSRKRGAMNTELKTRLVFIDTEVFRSKNYQFGEHTLQKLEEHLKHDRLHLLLSSITVNEIKSQIRDLSNEAHIKLKKFQKEAMFLKNAPSLPCYQAFQKINYDQIYGEAITRFESFLNNENVEVVTFEGVKIAHVFDKYFSSSAPFGKGSKKSEFPDAFSIEAVVRAAERRQHELYVISKDGDLKKYTDKNERLHHLQTIEELLELVIRTEEILVEPAAIGDKFISENKADIAKLIIEEMQSSEFYPIDDEGAGYDVTRIDIKSVKIDGYKILSATRDNATYEIEFSAQILAELEYADYDSSPWDSEDKEYLYIVHRSFTRVHNEQYLCFVTIDFSDGLPINAEVSDIEFESSGFDLNDIDGDVIESKY